jgi:hypothetical protein
MWQCSQQMHQLQPQQQLHVTLNLPFLLLSIGSSVCAQCCSHQVPVLLFLVLTSVYSQSPCFPCCLHPIATMCYAVSLCCVVNLPLLKLTGTQPCYRHS